MIINLFEPPPEKKTGGLDPAIRSIEEFLKGAGVKVRCNPTVEELGQSGAREIAHFHGLWEPKFLKISARCRRARIPYVVSPHGMLQPWERGHKRWKKWPWFQLLERHHLAGAAKLLTTSDEEARNLGKFFSSEKCVALPLGLTANQQPDYAAARRALGWGNSEIVLLFLSRIHPKKGLLLLLKALTQLGTEALQRVRLVIVGGGEESYVRELKMFVQREQAWLPKVDWVGEVWGDAKWAYFQGADLFCLTSFSENFGLAVLEALQVGTRVLTTDRTPWDAVPTWGAGFVVAPVEGAVQSALTEFLMHPEWRVEHREKLAAEIHRRFSWDAVGPPYLRFYADILRSATPRPGETLH